MTSSALVGNKDLQAKYADKTPPILTFSIPGNDSSLKVDNPIILNFNEPIKAGNGRIIISSEHDTHRIPITDTSQVTIINDTFGQASSVHITPSIDLKPNTHYSIEIETGAIKDRAGNTFVGLPNGDSINFTSIVSNPILNFTNLHGRLEANADLEFAFDERINSGAGNIIISNGDDTRTIAMHDTSQVSVGKFGFTVNPTEDLIPNTQYTVQFDPGIVTDQQGNPYLGESTNTQLSFYAALPQPPIFWGSNLQDEFNPIQTDGVIELFFNAPIMAGNGNIIISSGTDTQTIFIHDISQVNFLSESGLVIIDPILDFKEGTEYSIRIDPGAITDEKGDVFEGFNEDTALHFEPISTTPILLGSNPWDESMAFKNDQDIHLFFNEQVMPGKGNIIISNGADTRTIPIDDASRVHFDEFGGVTIDPFRDLMKNKNYSIRIDEGAITDLNGNPYAGIQDKTTLNFRTISSNPQLMNSIPSDDATGFSVDRDIELWFDEIVEAGKGNIILSNGTDTRIIPINDSTQVTIGGRGKMTIDPVEDLVPNTTYHIQMAKGVIVDSDGYAYLGIQDKTTLNFTTIPSDPVLIDSNPMDGSTFEADNSIHLNFNEAVFAGSGNIVISNGSDIRTINVTDPDQVVFSGNTVIINPTEDLQTQTNYSLHIDHGAIRDFSGYTYAGIDDDTTLNFSVVEDLTSPTLIQSWPLDDSAIFPFENILLEFDDKITAGSGNITISNGTDIRIIDVADDSQVSFLPDGITMVIDTNEAFIIGSTYHLTIDEGAILDTAGHVFTGIQDNSTLNFVIVDPYNNNLVANPNLVETVGITNASITMIG
ncbi:MAG: Ig-like domain-containing protein [Pseudomonadota bacterium]